MLVPGHPSHPQGCRDHETMLGAAETTMGLLIDGQGHYFMRHSAVWVFTCILASVHQVVPEGDRN